MKSKKTPTVGNPGDVRTPLQAEADRQDLELVAMMRSQELDDGIAEISRRPVSEADFGYIGEIPARTFSRDMIRKVYGGGDYKIQFKSAAGKFVGRTAFKVDYSIPALYPGARRETEEKGDRTPEIISAVTAALKSAIPPPAAPADNQLLIEVLRQNGEMAKAALAQRSSSPDAALLAQLAEMRAELREIKSSGGRRNGSLRDALEDFQALQELTGGNGGGGDSSPDPKMTPMMQLLVGLAPAFAPLLSNVLSGAAAAAQPGIPGSAPALMPAADPAAGAVTAAAVIVQPNPSAPANPTTTQHPAMNPLFRAYIASFKTLAMTAARKGKDAFDWADSTLDSVPANFHTQIFQLANAEDWFQQIFGGDPEATKFLSWLLEMRNAVLTRAMIAEVTAAYLTKPRPEPEAFASAFLDKVSVSYHAALWDELEAENWPGVFSQSEIDAVWLERLRVAFEKELAEPEAAPAAAAAAGAPRETVKPAAKPAAKRRTGK